MSWVISRKTPNTTLLASSRVWLRRVSAISKVALQNAVIIDVTTIEHTGKVIFGTTVEIANCETDESVIYQIVGEDEADIKKRKISVGSPIARALIGKEEGDVVVVQTPERCD